MSELTKLRCKWKLCVSLMFIHDMLSSVVSEGTDKACYLLTLNTVEAGNGLIDQLTNIATPTALPLLCP